MAPSCNDFSATVKENVYTKEEVRKHCTADDCWVIESGRVCDVTRFLKQHPGGADLVLAHAGNDITDYLLDKTTHLHSKNAFSLLKDFQIGDVEYNIKVLVNHYLFIFMK